jgi:DNA-binding response OmpR family regulator
VAGRKIMIDQADALTARFLATLFAARGFEVASPAAGQFTLDAVRAAAPDLLVTDLAAPGGESPALLSTLRADSRLARLPVVVLSVRDREQDIVRAFEEGADDYVVKPFRALELVARIERLLDRRRRTY